MCKVCEKNPAVSDSGLCGPCLRSSLNGPVAAPVIAFHSWKACPGAIVPERVGVDAFALKCAECGKTVGLVEPGLFENWSASAEMVAVFGSAAAAA